MLGRAVSVARSREPEGHTGGLVVPVCQEAQSLRFLALLPLPDDTTRDAGPFLSLSGWLLVLRLVSSWFQKGCCSSRRHVYLDIARRGREEGRGHIGIFF